MVDITNTKIAFLKNKPKMYKLATIIIVFLILLIYSSYKIKIYDNYQTKGYITCESICSLVVSIPSDISFSKINVNNKELDYNTYLEELVVDEVNLVSYKKITLDINGYQDKEIVDVNFYYNKQRIISKIIKKMF